MTETHSISMPSQPHGIRGWLIFPMLGTCISPLINLKGTGDSLDALNKPEFATYLLSLRVLLITELVVGLALVCAWVFAIVLLFNHKRKYPVLFNALVLFTLVWGAGELTFISVNYGVAPDPSDLKDVARAFVASIIWVPYMLRSKRVANTFVK